MSSRRNDRCHCGSGKKYKRCHGAPNRSVVRQQPALVFSDRRPHETDKFTFGLGGPGVTIGGFSHRKGDFGRVTADPNSYDFLIEVDLPLHLPLDDDEFSINIDDTTFIVEHQVKERGEEQFNTLDTHALPYFSSLRVRGAAFIDEIVETESRNDDIGPGHYKSYILLRNILRKLDAHFSRHASGPYFRDMPPLSYALYYVDRVEQKRVADIIYHSGTISARYPVEIPEADREELKRFLAQSIKIEAYAQGLLRKQDGGAEFQDRVFELLHDFVYYCRQSSEAIQALSEERIRDLFLILPRIMFGYAEGEAYNFDGKVDFKIINPVARHEFVTGEFKWWDGVTSLRECTKQAFEKHATGQEAEIYVVLLSKRKTARDVLKKAQEEIVQSPDCRHLEGIEKRIPKGSHELFDQFEVTIRGRAIPVCLAVADLYHRKVA